MWSPHLKGLNEEIERVQRRATKHITQTKHLSYEERLDVLKLASPTLQYLQKRADLLLVYKMINNLVDIDKNTYCSLCPDKEIPAICSKTRGHTQRFNSATTN